MSDVLSPPQFEPSATPFGERSTMTERRQRLFLVDGSNNLYRCYYAIRGLSNSSGLSTNAVYGFIQMLRKLIKEQTPDAIGVAFDVGSSTFRNKLFDDYKKDRKPMPDDLRVQIPFVYEFCEAFGIPVIGMQEYEADDVIGALACKGRDAGYEVVIATSDKDFFQLVEPGVSFYHTTREALYDDEKVKEVFGLAPSQVVDVMAIWGDAIDGIPGVPGIGEKGAKSLITEFGSLDGLYDNLDKVQKASHRKALEEHREKAYLSRDLAKIMCDIDVGIELEALLVKPPDRVRLHDLFSRLEFHSLMQEFLPEQPPVPRDYRRIETAGELESWLAEDQGILAIHLEESAAGETLQVSLSTTESAAVVFELKDEMPAVLRSLLGTSRHFVVHDAKNFLRYLLHQSLPFPVHYDDVMIMSYVLNPGAFGHTYEHIARERLTRDVLSRKELLKASGQLTIGDGTAVDYFAEKAELTLAFHALLEPLLRAEETLLRIYDEIELPLIPLLLKMEESGIRIDLELLAQMSAELGETLATIETKIYAEAGEMFNINSPTQLSVILFEKLQYPVLKKTKTTKSSSTGADVLLELASYGYAVPKLIIDHRELHKLKSTYVDALPQIVGDDGRVHTRFNQAVASTGRLSSSDPNLQNIPIRTAQGRAIRKAFIADPGNVLLAADYSQIELRILAHVTNDADLIDAFRRGVDIHRATAAKMFNVNELLVAPDQRRAAKTINFGVLYGMSAFRLSSELAISTGEAKEFIDSYFARYPTIRRYLDETLEGARVTGKVTTMFGRVRHIPEIQNKSFTVRGNAERMATNAPIQGAAADLLKMAMLALGKRLDAETPETRMLLTVHDEIVLETPEDQVSAVELLVKTTMENIFPLAVPLAVETHWGKSWYDAKE